MHCVSVTMNVIFFTVGIALLSSGMYYHFHVAASTNCNHFLRNTLLILGGIVTLLSLLGLIGLITHTKIFVMYLHLVCILICAVLGLSIYVFMMSDRGDPSLSDAYFKGENWEVLRRCLVDSHACQAFTNRVNSTAFLHQKFSPIVSGCCKPPSDCRFVLSNTTFWTNTTSLETSSNKDCGIWSNNPNELCYNCSSCKDGFVANVMGQWRSLGFSFIPLMIYMMLLVLFGLCLVRGPPSENDCRTAMRVIVLAILLGLFLAAMALA